MSNNTVAITTNDKVDAYLTPEDHAAMTKTLEEYSNATKKRRAVMRGNILSMLVNAKKIEDRHQQLDLKKVSRHFVLIFKRW